MKAVTWMCCYQGDEGETLDIKALGLHPELLARLQELGIIELAGNRITPDQLRRVYQVFRLRRWLGVNLSGASIIIDLLERIAALEDEIARLRGR